MKTFIHNLTHLNARKRVHVALGSLLLALTITITGVLAWASYTGIAAEGNLKNPDDEPKDFLGFSSGGVVVAGSPDPDPEGMPFQCDGAVIKNPNNYPLLIRVSL
ncbi:MAG: hypothetical protein FWC27_06760 [Firmicutes bacterium]|nr:hypothetical protein [Bacillota bacterium]